MVSVGKEILSYLERPLKIFIYERERGKYKVTKPRYIDCIITRDPQDYPLRMDKLLSLFHTKGNTGL